MAKATVILPTYNERDNLEDIVRALLALPVPELSVLVVDDNSPDGTGQLADDIARREPRVAVLHRKEKEGLGKAYVAGFQEVLRDPTVAYVFEMDADFSHQPRYIPDFLRAIESADIVLGSRYIQGGGVENWHAMRLFISSTANRLIRLILGSPIHDLTGGYKCFRRVVLEKMDLAAVASRGYNFQIELTYRAYRAGWHIREIPITFVERRAGKSKFSIGIMFESFWQVILLRLGRKKVVK